MIGDFLEKCEKLNSIKNEIVNLVDEIGIYLKNNERLFTEADKIEKEVVDKKNEVKLLKAEADGFARDGDEIKHQAEMQAKKLVDKAEADVKEMWRVVETEIDRIEKKDAQLNVDLKKYHEDASSLKAKQNQFIVDYDKYKKEKDVFAKELDVKEIYLKKEIEKYEALNNDLYKREKEVEEKEEQICFQVEGIGKRQADLDEATENILRAQRELGTKGSELNKKEDNILSEKKSLDAHDVRSSELDEREKELNKKNASMVQVKSDLDTKDRNLKDRKINLDELEGRLRKIESDLNNKKD